jgi:hypothetical protein
MRRLEQHSAQADVEQTDGNRKRQDRQLGVGNHGAGNSSAIGCHVTHGLPYCKEVANKWQSVVCATTDYRLSETQIFAFE